MLYWCNLLFMWETTNMHLSLSKITALCEYKSIKNKRHVSQIVSFISSLPTHPSDSPPAAIFAWARPQSDVFSHTTDIPHIHAWRFDSSSTCTRIVTFLDQRETRGCAKAPIPWCCMQRDAGLWRSWRSYTSIWFPEHSWVTQHQTNSWPVFKLGGINMLYSHCKWHFSYIFTEGDDAFRDRMAFDVFPLPWRFGIKGQSVASFLIDGQMLRF